MKNPEFNKVRSLFTAFVTTFIFLFIGCPHTPDTEQNPNSFSLIRNGSDGSAGAEFYVGEDWKSIQIILDGNQSYDNFSVYLHPNIDDGDFRLGDISGPIDLDAFLYNTIGHSSGMSLKSMGATRVTQMSIIFGFNELKFYEIRVVKKDNSIIYAFPDWVYNCKVSKDGKTYIPQDNKESDNPTNPDNPKEPESDTDNTAVIYKFFWGTWQRMDNGNLYVIDENKITVYDSDGKKSKEYTASSSTNTTLSASSFTFTKDSDRIITCDNIPYFRKGGTNLEYKLKLVGFEDSVARAAATTDVSGIPVKGQSKKYPSYTESTYSDEDGNIVLHAPVSGDIQTVTISNDDSVIVVPGIKIDNNGSNLGTIPIANSDQYLLKITGSVDEADKTDGYLYANGYKAYPLNLTITNIGDKDCPSNWYDITADSPYLTIEKSAESEYPLEGPISTLRPGATLTVKLTVKCGNITKPYIDTGLNVTFGDTKQKWIDYVPLRFHRGVEPLTFAAAQNGHNFNAVLNGFVIYPDNNTKFFAVDQNAAKTLYVPSFSSDEEYILVFSGATADKNLSNSTEMFYTVAVGTTGAKTVSIPTDREQNTQIRDYAEDNNTEKKAYLISESFEAYIGYGDMDFYKLSLSEQSIISASNVPKDYWEASAYSVKPAEDTVIASYSLTGVIGGTLGNSDSWVIHGFMAKKGVSYTIEWGDSENTIDVTVDSIPISYDGSASIEVSAYDSSTKKILSETTKSKQIVSVNTEGWIYINILATNEKGGTYSFRVTDNNSNPQTIYYMSGSGYAGYSWTIGELKSSSDSKLYYFFAQANTDYLLRWSDAGDGFGHTADVEILASTNVNDFISSDSLIPFDNTDSGYTKGQLFSVKENGYVYFKVQPQSVAGYYEGTFGLCLIDNETTNLQNVEEYNSSTFVIPSAIILGDEAWTNGQLFTAGYEVFKFEAKANATYAIVWDDSVDGSGDYTADVLVSAYSNSDFTQAYWQNVDSGFNTVKTVTPKEDGWIYVKISPKFTNTTGTFRIAVPFGPVAYLMQNSIFEYASHNCKFNAYRISDNEDAVWLEGKVSSVSDDIIYYFMRESNKVYKIFIDDAYKDSYGNSGTGKYSANTKAFITTSAVLTPEDTPRYPSYMDCRAFSWNTDGVEYLHVKAYDEKGLGTFAVTVLDGDNKPVELTELKVKSGSDIAEGWTTGELTSINDRIVYRYQVKKNSYWRMFWDDKSQGSGKYTADIEVMVGASDEDTTKNYALDNGYNGGWYSTYSEDTILYFYVTVKGSADGKGIASNLGTYAITIVEGNDVSSDFVQVTPNTSVSLSNTADISISSSVEDSIRIFSVDSGYESYKWYVDGVMQSSKSNVFNLDVATLKTGTYEIEVEVKKGVHYYSSTIFLKVE